MASGADNRLDPNPNATGAHMVADAIKKRQDEPGQEPGQKVTVNAIIDDLTEKGVFNREGKSENDKKTNQNLYNNLIALRDGGIISTELESLASSPNPEVAFNELVKKAQDNIVSTNTDSVDPSRNFGIRIPTPIAENSSISVIVDGNHNKPVQLTQEGKHYTIERDNETGVSTLSITPDGLAKLKITNPSAGAEGKEHSFQIWGIKHQETKETVYIPKINLKTGSAPFPEVTQSAQGTPPTSSSTTPEVPPAQVPPPQVISSTSSSKDVSVNHLPEGVNIYQFDRGATPSERF